VLLGRASPHISQRGREEATCRQPLWVLLRGQPGLGSWGTFFPGPRHSVVQCVPRLCVLEPLPCGSEQDSSLEGVMYTRCHEALGGQGRTPRQCF